MIYISVSEKSYLSKTDFFYKEQLNTENKDSSQDNCYMDNCCFPRQKQSTYQWENSSSLENFVW